PDQGEARHATGSALLVWVLHGTMML
ncbi:MAG: hypothetical protein QOE11_676, partial [Solirubrobacteraceae bacterium]|nr:hypothetical protein [Solirubrobacteraceae bacterium]